MATAAPATQASKTAIVQDVRMFSLGCRPAKVSLFAGRQQEAGAAEEQARNEIRAHGLAEIRKSRRLTQQQVAAQMGVTAARISQIEHGQVERAAIWGLAGYVAALGGHLELVASFGDERIVIGLSPPRVVTASWPSPGSPGAPRQIARAPCPGAPAHYRRPLSRSAGPGRSESPGVPARHPMRAAAAGPSGPRRGDIALC
jgi:DNA-binding XRE family transcriptional regulator